MTAEFPALEWFHVPENFQGFSARVSMKINLGLMMRIVDGEEPARAVNAEIEDSDLSAPR